MPLADTPASPAWPDPPPMSALHAILLFVGVPLLIAGILVLLVYAPSLVRGPRYRPDQPWDAEPALFGSGTDADPAPQLTAGAGAPASEAEDSTGGASVRW